METIISTYFAREMSNTSTDHLGKHQRDTKEEDNNSQSGSDAKDESDTEEYQKQTAEDSKGDDRDHKVVWKPTDVPVLDEQQSEQPAIVHFQPKQQILRRIEKTEVGIKKEFYKMPRLFLSGNTQNE
jgi:hypothetical protein